MPRIFISEGIDFNRNVKPTLLKPKVDILDKPAHMSTGQKAFLLFVVLGSTIVGMLTFML